MRYFTESYVKKHQEKFFGSSLAIIWTLRKLREQLEELGISDAQALAKLESPAYGFIISFENKSDLQYYRLCGKNSGIQLVLKRELGGGEEKNTIID